MKTILLFGFLGFFVCPLWALDRGAFTFTAYDLNVRIEPEQQRLAARGTLSVRNDSNSPQTSIALQISSALAWRSIQIDGKPVAFTSQTYTSDIDHTGALTEAIVIPPRPIGPKQQLELKIAYEGLIPQDHTRLDRIGVPSDVAKHSDWDEITNSFTAVRGIGYVAWYPISTEAVSLSNGNSVIEEVGRWKRRESEALMKEDLCAPNPNLRFLMNSPDGDSAAKTGAASDMFTCGAHAFAPL